MTEKEKTRSKRPKKLKASQDREFSNMPDTTTLLIISSWCFFLLFGGDLAGAVGCGWETVAR